MRDKRLWQKGFKEYEALTGFDLMFTDELERGEMSAREVWQANVEWLEDLCADVIDITVPVLSHEEIMAGVIHTHPGQTQEHSDAH